jgi:hypothetical protein
MKDEIIGGSPLPISEKDNIQRSTISDPTFSKAAVLTANITLLYMERTVNAIDRALMRLDEVHNEIFEYKYRRSWNWRQIVCEMCISERQYFKKRKELIMMVAEYMGMKNPY